MRPLPKAIILLMMSFVTLSFNVTEGQREAAQISPSDLGLRYQGYKNYLFPGNSLGNTRMIFVIIPAMSLRSYSIRVSMSGNLILVIVISYKSTPSSTYIETSFDFSINESEYHNIFHRLMNLSRLASPKQRMLCTEWPLFLLEAQSGPDEIRIEGRGDCNNHERRITSDLLKRVKSKLPKMPLPNQWDWSE